jgi:hypothetical protein
MDHLNRRHSYEPVAGWAQSASPMDRIGDKRVPARSVHVNQSYGGAPIWPRDNIADTVLLNKLMRTGWGIINVWRPLAPVQRDPLAVCDGSSVADGELTEVVSVLGSARGKFGEASKGAKIAGWNVQAPREGDGGHKWCYYPDMQPDEVLLIKCFDSKMEGHCQQAPHSAFDNPEKREEGQDRALRFDAPCSGRTRLWSSGHNAGSQECMKRTSVTTFPRPHTS